MKTLLLWVAKPSPALSCSRTMPLSCLQMWRGPGSPSRSQAHPTALSLQCCTQKSLGWGDFGSNSNKDKATRLENKWQSKRRGAGPHQRGPVQVAKNPFVVLTTHLLFSFTNLVIKKKTFPAF